MISVEEARKILKNHPLKNQTIELALEEAAGHILAEDLVADRDFPPYNRVTMDGIAISYAGYEEGQRKFLVEDIAAAGAAKKILTSHRNCLEVMTGSTLPDGADTVIRYEDITVEDGHATINEEISQGLNIHYQGEDKKQGEILLTKGSIIQGPESALAASIGKSKIKVTKTPSVVMISTGDELIDIDDTPKPHQIRKSNNYMIAGALFKFGIKPDQRHIKDNFETTVSTLRECLQKYDIIMLSGGVSRGKFDFIPKALAEVGVNERFHKIQQRPGKPFLFGTHETRTSIFGFPGNPVSSFMCFMNYFVPWLKEGLGQSPTDALCARLSRDVTFLPDLTYYIQVFLKPRSEGVIEAQPIEGHGSGDLTNLVNVNAFMELPTGKNEFKAGETYPVIVFKEFS